MTVVSRQLALADITGLTEAPVYVDTYKQASDPDDTLSFSRAFAAGVPIILGPRTYSISNLAFSNAVSSKAIIIGVAGKTIIFRNTSSNMAASFWSITSLYVFIDGIILDYNGSNLVTGNQWGLLITSSAGEQFSTVRNSVFKNNIGSLGSGVSILGNVTVTRGGFEVSGCEFTNCTRTLIDIMNAANGIVTNNYCHDANVAGVQALGTAGVAWARDIIISNNRFARLPSGAIGGGIGVPYDVTQFSAKNILIEGNQCIDISGYALVSQGDHVDIIGNSCFQSSPSFDVTTAIGGMGRFGLIANNTVDYTDATCVDIGGCLYYSIIGNHFIARGSGGCLNIGGTTHLRVANNHLEALGNGATSICSIAGVLNMEGDGGGGLFPYVHTGMIFENNKCLMDSSTARGVQIFDNAGAAFGTGIYPNKILNNDFILTNSASNQYCLYNQGSGLNVIVNGNTVNGSGYSFSNPNGNNDIVYEEVFDNVVTFTGASTTIRSVIPRNISDNGSIASKILWINLTAGGLGYHKATTTVSVAGSGGGSGFVGSAKVHPTTGAILGIAVTNSGSGFSGTLTVTITDTDPVPGTGATATAGVNCGISHGKSLLLTTSSVTSLLGLSGGGTTLRNNEPLWLTGQNEIRLKCTPYIGQSWYPESYTPPTFAIGSIPAAATANAGSFIRITGSTTSKWLARSNGTNWIWPDGTTVTT